MIFFAASMSLALRSGIFRSAISWIWASEIVPTLFTCGSPEPFGILIASLIRMAAGGVFVTKVKERSSKTVISTGMIVPPSPWVWALKALQKSMMLTPCWPSAGPTGGAGLALPAWICSLMTVRGFFAMRIGEGSGLLDLDLLDLVVADLHGGLPPEDRDQHLQFGGVLVDLGDL